MIAPETLLRMHPLDAVRAQIGETLVAPLKATHLKIEAPVAVSGTTTQVTVSLDKSKAPVELWDSAGTHVFEYQRLNLPDFLSGLDLNVKATPPVTAESLLRAILQPYRIPVADNDLIVAEYTQLGAAQLISDPHSWRWIGEIDCTIVVLGIDISPLLLVKSFTLPYDVQYYSGNIKPRLVTYINLANPNALPEALTPAMFTLSDPVAQGLLSDPDNTAINLIFNGKPYTGSVTVTYQRRAFEDTFRFPVQVSGNQPGYTAELAGRLSTQMGCTITASDIRSDPFPPLNAGTKIRLPVTFNAKSLAYVGSVLVEYSRTS